VSVVVSSGHGKFIRGASGYLDEVNENRRVVERVAEFLRSASVPVKVFHDDTSRTQSVNLNTIVNYHNAQSRALDVSVHFNAYQTTSKAMGAECLYKTQKDLSAKVSKAISDASGLLNRGAKYRDNLSFLNRTAKPAILIEVCFVDSSTDASLYQRNFEGICRAIAQVIANKNISSSLPLPQERPEDLSAAPLVQVTGRCSWFGGPNDLGVTPSEGLAFLFKYEDAPHLFLPEQPPGTTGLARRLNPGLFYVACRWDYEKTPKKMLARPSFQALVSAKSKSFLAWPADWGPHEQKTGRAVDLSPALMDALGIKTDEEVEVIYPAAGE